MPTLPITGAAPADRYVETVSSLVAAVEEGHRETMPGAGHAAQIDNPDAFNETLRGILSDTL